MKATLSHPKKRGQAERSRHSRSRAKNPRVRLNESLERDKSGSGKEAWREFLPPCPLRKCCQEITGFNFSAAGHSLYQCAHRRVDKFANWHRIHCIEMWPERHILETIWSNGGSAWCKRETIWFFGGRWWVPSYILGRYSSYGGSRHNRHRIVKEYGATMDLQRNKVPSCRFETTCR